jgi:hypothetical protein
MNAAPRRAPTLREAQRRLAALILNDAHDTAETDALVAVPARGGTAERLRVYAGGYPARIEDALNENFPAVAHILGEGAFKELAHRYAASVALRSYNLNDAGAELAQFLRADRLTASLPFLSDLAELEWQVSRAFHAHDHVAFDPAPLANWRPEEWERVVMRFQPWVALVSSDWPIRELWECRNTPVEEIDIDLRNRSDRVLVRRAGLAVVCESLSDPEAAALRMLLEGQSLGAVMATLTFRSDIACSVSAWFAGWVASGMVTCCEPQSPRVSSRSRRRAPAPA